MRFIRRHHVMTLTTVGAEGEPWSCNLFYAWMPGCDALVFTSQEGTRHTREMGENGRVAASIALETRIVGRIQGLQIQGVAERVAESLAAEARKTYLKRFPYAVFAPGELWVLKLVKLKYTDNTLGFGTKMHWSRESDDRNDRQEKTKNYRP